MVGGPAAPIICISSRASTPVSLTSALTRRKSPSEVVTPGSGMTLRSILLQVTHQSAVR